MINWQKINNKIFEDIAYEYMINNYPGLIWQKTKLTQDGNKDGESAISNLPFGTTIKYWYEAKYSININKSIPKSHLDSTLVSSLLDGHVVIIAFITNAYISDDYKRRADVFAKRCDNLRLCYINGEEIEDWLSDNPKIEEKYFNTCNAQKRLIIDSIEEVCFFDKYNNDSNQFINLSTLELNKEYILYIRFLSSERQRVELVFDNDIIPSKNYSDMNVNLTNLSVEKGNNAFFVPVKVKSEKKEYQICIKGETGVKKYILQGIRVLDLYKPKLVISSQIKLLNDINFFIKSNDLQNLIFLIVGEAGSGKTHILNMLRNNENNSFSSIALSFTGNPDSDFIICYKLFIYCHFGGIWELDMDNLEQLNFHSTIKDVLTEINIGLSSVITHEKLIEYCTKSDSRFLEQYFLQQQIYIDDIHKISSEVAELFQIILEWCSNQRLNKRIFLFTRDALSNLKCLDEFLRINACCVRKLEQLSLQDIKSSIQLNFGDVSTIVSIVQNQQPSFNALYLYNFLCALKEKFNYIKELDIIDTSVEVSAILKKINYTEKGKIKSSLLKEYNKSTVFYFVYKLENGVDIGALIDFFDESIYEEISTLCQKRIIKEKAGKLYPFHDILLDSFRDKGNNTYTKKLVEFILFCIEKQYFSQSDGYYYLVSLGGKYFWKYRLIAEEFREQLHDSASYYAAEKIAQKIQEENNKDLRDYDYRDVRNLFILGNCYKYTTSYEQSNEIFEKIKDVYKFNTMIMPDDILLETYSETINNNLWMLNIKKADLDLKKMHEIWNFDDSAKNKSKVYKYGYLNYYNRRMFCNFMLGIGTEDDYKTACDKAKELCLKEYEGFAHMDYAKSTYNIDIIRAKKLLEKAIKIFKEKNETRRLLDALSELAFIEVLQCKSYDTRKLKEISHTMKEKRYIQSYTRTQMKILVIMLLSDNYKATELLEKVNYILIKNTTIASGKRHQALVHHILGAIYYKNGDLVQSIECSQKCLELFDELGDTYKNIHYHNTQLKKCANIIIGFEKTSGSSPNNFILDSRIW